VVCQSQENPRRIVPDGVPPEAANLGFQHASCPKQLDRPPRRLDRPVLGGSASGFPTTVRSSAFVCSTGKGVNTLLVTPMGTDLVFATNLSIFAWDHIVMLRRTM
jgi:hypothetical protein